MRVGGLTGEGWESVDVLIIGAGPAGALAAALLRQQGRQVLVLESEQFSRFSISESLLPQSMEYLEQAGMLRVVVEAGFQLKNGAAFAQGEQYTEFNFGEKHSVGWSTTYQVPRARFDHLLALAAEAQGTEIRYRHEVVAIDIDGAGPQVAVKHPGIDTFRAFVESWYHGGFQRIIFHRNQHLEIRRMISAILAGYAWDESNPYVREPIRRLAALEELCS